MNQVRRKNLKISELKKELMLIGWASQKPEIVREELESSLNRLEIDRSIFYLLFFKDKGHNKLKNGVEKIYKEHQNIFELIDSKATYSTKFGDKPVTFYNASILMEYLINRFNEKHNYSCYRVPFFMLIALLYGLSDGFVRLYYGQTFHGEDILSIIVFYLSTVINAIMVLSNLMFFMRYEIDITRKNYLLEQLGQLLSPRKQKLYSSEKILPTIDITCGVSLHTWTNMRRLVFDYGLKYLRRHELFLPTIAAVGLISSLMVLELGFLHYVTPNKMTIEIQKLQAFALMNALFMFLVFLSIIFFAEPLNEHFNIHSQILKSNVALLKDIQQFDSFYFGRYIQDKSVASLNKLFTHKTHSQLHRIMVQDYVLRNGEKEAFQKMQEQGYQTTFEKYDEVL